MKVCFLVGTLARGGAEKQLVYMLRALKNAGLATQILCLTEGESYESEIRALGVEIEFGGDAKNRAARILTIMNSLRKKRVDVVQSSHFYTNIYAGLAGRFLKIPSIGAIRSDLTAEMAAHGRFGKWQIRLPHFLIANSELARKRAIERGLAPDKIEFVRNVVETPKDDFQIAPKSAAAVKLLFVGRLDRKKRPDRFVRLAAILRDKFPHRSLEFRIAGDGILREELEKQARDLDLSPGRLFFLGERREMSRIYRQADILVSTSALEGTPNAVLEAMAHKLPVVATNAGGTGEVLNENCGFLIPAEDENALVAACARLIENPNLRRKMGAEGFVYVEKNHSLKNLQTHLIEIYERLRRQPLEHSAQAAYSFAARRS